MLAAPDDVHVEVEPLAVDHRPGRARSEQRHPLLVGGVVGARAGVGGEASMEAEPEAVVAASKLSIP